MNNIKVISGIIAPVVGTAIFFLLVSLLFSCVETQEPIKENLEYKMNCEQIEENGVFFRCENKEVVCYMLTRRISYYKKGTK